MAGILDWVVESAKKQYAKGAPYREAVGGLLQGDMNKVNQALSQSDLTPMDFALMMGTSGVGGKLPKIDFEAAHKLAQQRASLPIAEGGLGLHPQNTAMGGIIKTIKPAKESLHEVANSNFLLGIPVGNKTVDINSLKGIMSNSSSDIDKVNKLTQKMKSPEGYIERLIVDDAGNILEGQHRLNALRNLGETQVPVSVIKDMSNAVENVKKTGMRNEHAINIVQNAHDMLQEAKTPENAFQMFDIPSEYTNAYKAAFESMK